MIKLRCIKNAGLGPALLILLLDSLSVSYLLTEMERLAQLPAASVALELRV
jgi:hypothetical protein